jgi:hypothetical protein
VVDEAPPPTDDGRAYRIIRIGANLLPVEIVVARRMHKIRWIVITSLILFIGLLAAWYLRDYRHTGEAEVRVGQAQDQVQHLQRQQRQYAEVVSVQADSKSIRTQLSTLLASDVQWAKLMGEVQAAAPSGVSLVALLCTVNVGDTPPDQAGHLPSTTTDKTVGAVTVVGTGPDKVTVAGYVDALAKVPGLANPQVSDIALQDGRVRFTVRLDVTAARLGGRYTTPSPSAAPGATPQATATAPQPAGSAGAGK